MDRNTINDLAARLERADRLSPSEHAALYRDIQRYARIDLYGAARLCKDHLHPRADFRLPAVVMAAERIGRHFEQRMNSSRRPVDLALEKEQQLRQPEDRKAYQGPVVGTTPNCLIQRDNESGDLIVHPRANLVSTFDPSEKDNDLSIRYPFQALGGAGLVTDIEQEHSLEAGLHGHQREAEHSGMEFSR